MNKLLHGNFDWSNKAGWNNVKDLEISLPVQTEDVPDWDLMKRYIRAIEKLVIKDVVNFKDVFIAKAKEVTA